MDCLESRQFKKHLSRVILLFPPHPGLSKIEIETFSSRGRTDNFSKFQ